MTIHEAFQKLKRSPFRMRFHLDQEDIAYIERVGFDVVRSHAADFVRRKLADTYPLNDGKQTPMHGHPVFKAMHGSAMCCRGCMEKWWHVRQGVALSEVQQRKIVNFLMEWVMQDMRKHANGEKNMKTKSNISTS